jgi:hypothetical protein
MRNLPLKSKRCQLFMSLVYPTSLVSYIQYTSMCHTYFGRIELNDATVKTREIGWMENSVQSWHRRLVFRHHLITLSALYSKDCGMVRPICFAVLRLITNSNFVGCSTGKSAGLAPFKILST